MRNRVRGRPKSLDYARSKRARELMLQGIPIPQITHQLDISRATFYRYKSSWNLGVINVGIEDAWQKKAIFYKRTRTFEQGILWYDVQVAKWLGDQLNAEVRFHPLSFEKITSGEVEGLDFSLAWLSRTESREKNLSFSEPYLRERDRNVYLCGRTNPRNYREKPTVGVQRNTRHHYFLQLRYPNQYRLQPFNRLSTLISSFERRRVQFIADHRLNLSSLLKKDSSLQLFDHGFLDHDGISDTCIAFPKGSDELLDRVNHFLYDGEKEGTLNQLRHIYIPDA